MVGERSETISEMTLRLGRERSARNRGPLWPEPYASDPWQFVLQLRTWNEAEAEVQFFPDLPYLEALTREWTECRKLGRPLIVEKCRRMVVSWLFRALELYAMGMARNDVLIGGLDYDAAARHVWRLKHLYDDLRARNRAWNLPECKFIRAKGDRMLEQFGLPNGSLCQMVNQESSSVVGEGVGIITLEELSRYRYPASTWAQAKIVTKGRSGKVGGFVVAVCNAYPNDEWKAIKTGGKL